MSALARALGPRLAGRFARGVRVCGLAEANGPEGLSGEVAPALGASIADVDLQLAAAGELLLILDTPNTSPLTRQLRSNAGSAWRRDCGV